MIKIVPRVFFLFVLMVFLCSQSSITQTQTLNSKIHQRIEVQNAQKALKVDFDYGKIPLYFIPNKGQVHEKALFYAKASRYTLWITKQGLVFDRILERDRLPGIRDQKYERDVSKFIFLDSNKNPEVIPLGKTEYKVNYFVGNDQSKWRTDISASKAVLYKELYKSIDLKVYGIEKQVEYDWVVRPGGKVSDIRFEYENVKDIRIDEKGNLVVETEFGELRQTKPVCFQVIEEKRISIKAEFKRIEKNIYGFEVKKYNRDYKLIIDPMVYSTYLGGSETNYDAEDKGKGIAVDKRGAAYVTGNTNSLDFPTKNPFQGDLNRRDAFVTKIKPNGKDLVYSTFLGGTGLDYGNAIAVDEKGCAYVTGDTLTSDFPTKNPFQANLNGKCDVFVSKLNPDGNALLYSTYLGGSDYDYGYGIAVNKKGSAYVTGIAYSSDFPTKKPFQENFKGVEEAFVTRLNKKGNGLVYSTYLGGSDKDRGGGIAVDKKGNAYVTGWTLSTDFPTENPLQENNAGWGDVFITKINAKGKTLLYSTYLGGSCWDTAYGIAIDEQGSAYVIGQTSSSDYPTKNPFQDSLKGVEDALVAKINSKGDTLLYSTYLGGSDAEIGCGIAVKEKFAYVIGRTYSSDFPTEKPVQKKYKGDGDAFVTRLNLQGNGLVYSTYLGGSKKEWGFGIAVDKRGAAYATGETYSKNFPTKNPFQENQKGIDAFITKIK